MKVPRLLVVFSVLFFAEPLWAKYQTLTIQVSELLPEQYPEYVVARAEELKIMFGHGEITVETYADEIEKIMQLTMVVVDPKLSKLSGGSDFLFMDNYRRLAWDYGELDERLRSSKLENDFVRSYANRVVNFVKYSSDMVELFGDVIEGLAHIKNWSEESHQEKWETALPHRWFGHQWTYMGEYATETGRQSLSTASVLSTRANLALYDVRSLLPLTVNEVLDSDRKGVPELLVRMYDFSQRYAFVHFSEETMDYLKERDSFLGLRDDIVHLKRDACAVLLRRVL